jgi:CheY-like chemotaxis protein
MVVAPFAKGEIGIPAIVATGQAHGDGGVAPFPWALAPIPKMGPPTHWRSLRRQAASVAMEALAARRQLTADEYEPRVRLLIADDDRAARSLLASCARDAVGEIAVFEAVDGAEAIRLGLQQSPEVALLDVNMPRLGGIEAAVTLRQLKPHIRVALRTGDPRTQRDRAHEHRLPLFGKLELERTLAWLAAQVAWCTDTSPRKRSFVCGACGYGALRATPPGRCPMCHAEGAWIEAAWRPARMLSSR